MAKGVKSSLRGMYGGGGWYCASVKDQILPKRESFVSSNSSPAQAGLRQKNDAFGKKTVPQLVQRLPRSAGSSSVVNQPSIAGTAVRVSGPPAGVISDTSSDYPQTTVPRRSRAGRP